MRVVTLVGNPRPNSRTRAIAESLADRVRSGIGGSDLQVVDLCEYAGDIFRWPHEALAELSQSVASADLAIVASPTYKATYTGLLKAFLDRYPSGGLTGLTAVPVMTGTDPIHGMAQDFALRPLLVELGASVPTRGLYFPISQLSVAARILDDWAESNLAPLARWLVASGAGRTVVDG
jgi:FMN reductase